MTTPMKGATIRALPTTPSKHAVSDAPESVEKTLEKPTPKTMTATRHDRDDYLEEALILISTPAGKLNLLSASIVLAVACTMSITRL